MISKYHCLLIKATTLMAIVFCIATGSSCRSPGSGTDSLSDGGAQTGDLTVTSDSGSTPDSSALKELYANGESAYEHMMKEFGSAEKDIRRVLPKDVTFGYDWADERDNGAYRVCEGECIWVVYASIQDNRDGERWGGVLKRLPPKYQLRLNPITGQMKIGVLMPQSPEWHEFESVEALRAFLRQSLGQGNTGADAGISLKKPK